MLKGIDNYLYEEQCPHCWRTQLVSNNSRCFLQRKHHVKVNMREHAAACYASAATTHYGICSNHWHDPALDLYVKDCCMAVVALVNSFTAGYQLVFKLYFGLETGYRHTARDIGRVIGVTGMRVRHKVDAGLRRIERVAVETGDGRLELVREYGAADAVKLAASVLSLEEALAAGVYDMSNVFIRTCALGNGPKIIV